ncbi:DNA topoisomerase IB [Nocardia sp. NPDC059228]|uniref:DNA topoisomerase IB n=1 Tax=Nocardia sp. NPDC059228 TaxID=3346777 RepID=UPI00367CB048
MRLRRSDIHAPGIVRRRCGRGFSYTTAQGKPVIDGSTLERIRALAIPPAWRKVWICPHPNGHIQATGRDSAGRRQYLYHDQWRTERDEEKFDRVLDLAGHLPRMRDAVRADLAQRGFSEHRVLAVAIALLDSGAFRVGNEEYADTNGTYGVATLLRDHVQVSGEQISFAFPAKGGAQRQATIEDMLLAKAIQGLRRSSAPAARLLVCREVGGFRPIRAEDINVRFRELTGPEFSVKDLRTWQATVLAAVDFVTCECPESARARRAVVRRVMTDVSQVLGNTAAVARESYVDPRVVHAFEHGATVAAAMRKAQRSESATGQRTIIDAAVARLIHRAERGIRSAG